MQHRRTRPLYDAIDYATRKNQQKYWNHTISVGGGVITHSPRFSKPPFAPPPPQIQTPVEYV